MYDWMKKIHMYAGLLSYMAFFVWGVAGIRAVFLPPPGGYLPPEISAQREVPFEAPGDLDDEQLSQLLFKAAEIPMSGGHYNVHRNEEGNLAFFVFTNNGRRDVTYLEEEQRIRVEIRQNGLVDFLSSMHAGHSRRGAPDLSARFWGVYNEFSTWAFFFMSLSGIYLWVATRPRLPWAQLSIGGAAAVFVILWVATR
jgi:hypothetical protein